MLPDLTLLYSDPVTSLLVFASVFLPLSLSYFLSCPLPPLSNFLSPICIFLLIELPLLPDLPFLYSALFISLLLSPATVFLPFPFLPLPSTSHSQFSLWLREW